MEIDYDKLCFSPLINDEKLYSILNDIKQIYSDSEDKFKTAKLNKSLLELLIILSENYSEEMSDSSIFNKTFETVKNLINYIRDNYTHKILLDDIAKNIYCDKFVLSRNFKKVTGQTVVEYINNYRCNKAVNLIQKGFTVSEAANMCGFENLSFFTKTFKKHIGYLPSDLKEN